MNSGAGVIIINRLILINTWIKDLLLKKNKKEFKSSSSERERENFLFLTNNLNKQNFNYRFLKIKSGSPHIRFIICFKVTLLSEKLEEKNFIKKKYWFYGFTNTNNISLFLN